MLRTLRSYVRMTVQRIEFSIIIEKGQQHIRLDTSVAAHTHFVDAALDEALYYEQVRNELHSTVATICCTYLNCHQMPISPQVSAASSERPRKDRVHSATPLDTEEAAYVALHNALTCGNAFMTLALAFMFSPVRQRKAASH